VLHPIAELPKNNFWNIERILADEVNADAFGTDQSHHLLNFLFNCRLDVREQQMRFIKKENTSFGFSGSPISGRFSNNSDSIQSRNVA
jgi:hypothetical protein